MRVPGGFAHHGINHYDVQMPECKKNYFCNQACEHRFGIKFGRTGLYGLFNVLFRMEG